MTGATKHKRFNVWQDYVQRMARDQPKHSQHFVWRYYLEAWADEKKEVWLRKGPLIKRVPHKSQNQKRHFYKLQGISTEQARVALGLIHRVIRDPGMRMYNTRILCEFATLPFVLEYVKAQGAPKEAVDIVEAANVNHEENIHTRLEHAGLPYLKKLRDLDTSFLSTIEFAIFAAYLGAQASRGPKFSTRLKNPLNMTPNASGIYRLMLAYSIGLALIQNQANATFELLKAPPGTGFVTSDNPVTNMGAIGVEPREYTFHLLYPLSPEVAITCKTHAATPGVFLRTLDPVELRNYNMITAKSREALVFASTRRDLLAIPDALLS